jgi:hypothetical protein
VRSTEKIEKLVRNLDLDIETNAQTDQAVLSKLIDAQSKSMKQDSLIAMPNIRRLIMKNSKTKLAAAAVIIVAVLISINPFGNSKTSVLWADVAERFESVPFFHLTTYFGHDTSAVSEQVEIWKSEDGRVRVHGEDTVIFADFNKKEGKVLSFYRSTKEPKVSDGTAPKFVTLLCKEGRFSLDTLTNSLPPEIKDITPIASDDTAVSRETVLFEAKHETTPERFTIWALRRSKLPIRLRYQDPRESEYGDFFFDYSERKDPSFFDPAAFAKQ